MGCITRKFFFYPNRPFLVWKAISKNGFLGFSEKKYFLKIWKNYILYTLTRYIKYIFFRIAPLQLHMENSILSFQTGVLARKKLLKFFFDPPCNTPWCSVPSMQVWKKSVKNSRKQKFSMGKSKKITFCPITMGGGGVGG